MVAGSRCQEATQMEAMQHRKVHWEAYEYPAMAETEDEDLLDFLDELAGTTTPLAPQTCGQSSTISCLDAFGPDMTQHSQLGQAPSIRAVRVMPVHAQPLLTPKLVKTPEQILQQLFQRPSRALSEPSPLEHMRPCTAVPLHAAPELTYEALPSVLVPISQAGMLREEGSATLQILPLGSSCREGEASSSTRVTAAHAEGSPRSYASEPAARQPKKRPRRKTELWRINNQLAQKRFRQKQKDKQATQQELVYELSEHVAELEERQRSLQRALDARRQAGDEESRGNAVLDLVLLQIDLTRAEVCGLDLPKLSAIWKGVGGRIGALLGEALRCPAKLLLQQLQALGLEVLQLLQFLLEHHPGLVSASQGCSSEGCEGMPAAGAAPERSLWRGVLGRLELSQDQRKALLEARDAVLDMYCGLPSQCAALTLQLQAASAETDFCKQALILRQLRANADAGFVHRLMLELLKPV